MQSQPLRILVVDDHHLVRAGLRHLMSDQADLEIVGDAESAADAVTLAEQLEPDVVLLDLGLTDLQGPKVVEYVVRALPDIPVLVLTAYTDPAVARECLRLGAAGFVTKFASGEEAAGAIRDVAQGRLAVDQHIGAGIANGEAVVTARELEILAHVADGLTNRQIGSKLAVSEETVKTHLSRAMAKLGVSDRAQAVAVLLRRGLLQ